MTIVALGSDHAGFRLKTYLCEVLRQRGFEILDLGTNSEATIDYPPFCIAVGKAVVSGAASWGIVLGGSGQGEQMVANKVKGVRAALCNDPFYARLARRDNDANVMGLGARVIAPEFAIEILDTWLGTEFEGGRHARRLGLITEFEGTSVSP